MIDIKQLVLTLRQLDPEKIILYGSAVSALKPESDIDVLLIKKTKKKPSDRVGEVLPLVWGHVPHIEPQVMTPEEFSQAIADNRFFITQEVLKRGKVLYEKSL